MIIVVGKFQLRRGLDIELPGQPTSLSPLKFSPGLTDSELGFSQDSGRLFVGHSPNPGDANYQRTQFPYQNLEILTENSPRNAELFGGFMRDQNNRDFYVPATLPAAASPVAIPYSANFVGPAIPSRLNGSKFSAVIEYHAFTNDTTYTPVKAGTLYISAPDQISGVGLGAFDGTSNPNNFKEVAVENITGLSFQVGGRASDGSGFYRMLNYKNTTGSTLLLYLRRVVVTGLSAGL